MITACGYAHDQWTVPYKIFHISESLNGPQFHGVFFMRKVAFSVPWFDLLHAVIIALIAVADPSKREEGQKLAKSVPFFGQIMILGRVELLWGAE